MTQLSDHYSAEEIQDLINETDLDEDELLDWLTYDFIDEGDDIPDIHDLIHHIDYQQRLMSIASRADNDHEMGILWSEAFA